MPRIAYIDKTFQGKTQTVIDIANRICREYQAAGYDLTLRQLYYQFVARGYLANKQTEYKRLGDIINDARMAGQLDWDFIVDRTRNIEQRSSWNHPRDILAACADQFHLSYWEDQDVHVEVWVEKEALAGVIEDTCFPYDVTSLACRGYLSQSESWAAAQRFLRKVREGKRIVIIHLGDHDPSGIDMSRDNEDRIRKFLTQDLLRDLGLDRGSLARGSVLNNAICNKFGLDPNEPVFELNRIALNMDQIEQYSPPPNPAKMTDARFAKYEEEYGDESWELDALPPDVLAQLIVDALSEYMDEDAFEAAKGREAQYRIKIRDLLNNHGAELNLD